MKVIKDIVALQSISDFHKVTFKTIGFVPTMGYLHEGHVSLILRAREECDVVIVSIYVNPTQFLPGEDLQQYPRDFLRDYHMCKSSGADYIFYPDSESIYPEGYLTYVKVNDISDVLEGFYRPGHFQGVATIVSKLYNIVKPNKVYFGQKDAQQSVVIQKMTKDLNFDTEIVVCDTVREDNGLAMSSRNTYLTDVEKQEASVLYEALTEGKKMIVDYGMTNTDSVKDFMHGYIKRKSDSLKVQYLAITDNERMRDIENFRYYKGEVIISLAAYMGRTRLIDNVMFSYK